MVSRAKKTDFRFALAGASISALGLVLYYAAGGVDFPVGPALNSLPFVFGIWLINAAAEKHHRNIFSLVGTVLFLLPLMAAVFLAFPPYWKP